ncbi:MAG: histidine kinase [Chitinophagales bacterium]|nr:histidine kinase [Chitinophagales bacterium]
MEKKSTLLFERSFLTHLAIWFIVFVVPLSVLHLSLFWQLNERPQLRMDILQLYVYRIIATIGVFYWHYAVLLPRYFFQQRYVLYFSGVVLTLVLVPFVPHLFMSPLHPLGRPPLGPPPFLHGGQPPDAWVPPYFVSPLSNVFLLLSAVLVSFTMQVNKRYQEMKQLQLSSELSWLKAQINPHFLFNALNSIYLLSLKKSEKTSDAIIQLSEMMRYILSEANENRVSLEKEINYINNYIAIQQLRLAPTVQLRYEVSGAPLGRQIAPLILISFIENAFKYGISTTEPSPIDIFIHINPNKLHLQVSNRNFGLHKALSVGTGIGLENTQKRLQLFYPNQHQLQIIQNETQYVVDLVLEE